MEQRNPLTADKQSLPTEGGFSCDRSEATVKTYKTITWQEAQALWELGVFDFEWTEGARKWRQYADSCDPNQWFSPEQMHLKSSRYDNYRVAVE